MNNNNYSNHMGNYKRVVSNYGSGFRGIKLNIRKLSIQRLRVKFLSLLRRWKKTYKRAVKYLKLRRSRSKKQSSKINSYGYLIGGERKSSLMNRSNSFYSEAIADCLEFIKRNSLDHDDEAAPIVAALR